MSFVMDGIVYLEDDTKKICVIKSTQVNTAKVNIPAMVNGFMVVGIYDNAFSFNTDLTEITLPDTIRKIGAYAFTSCYNLKTIEFQKTEISTIDKGNNLIIGEKAFLCCYGLESANFMYKRLHIKNQCFDGCMSLIEIVGVIVSAQQDSFSNCEHLVSLTIANEVHVDFLSLGELHNLKYIYFGSKASISADIATVLAENNVIIHCPQISNMTELSYLGCVVNTY